MEFRNKNILIHGSGSSLKKKRNEIVKFIKKNKTIVIVLNTNDFFPESKIDYRVVCHPNRIISDSYFYKNISGSQGYNSSYQNFILSSGLKFNKTEIDMNLEKENSNCFILSGLCLGQDEHQEIKTQIKHLAPNCKSYQKIKNVLEDNSKGIYQGKIFVKDIAQKTDAYQLSKALILNDQAEFNAKPELEIYADDVKCSHGSTSGSIDEEAIHYLMTRGIELSVAKKLLINGFLNEIFENISEEKIKNFLEKSVKEHIDGI